MDIQFLPHKTHLEVLDAFEKHDLQSRLPDSLNLIHRLPLLLVGPDLTFGDLRSLLSKSPNAILNFQDGEWLRIDRVKPKGVHIWSVENFE